MILARTVPVGAWSSKPRASGDDPLVGDVALDIDG